MTAEDIIFQLKENASLNKKGTSFYCYRHRRMFPTHKLYYCHTMNCPHWDIRLRQGEYIRNIREFYKQQTGC
jgi:hypothetical protein